MKTLQALFGEWLDYRRGLNYSERSLEGYRYNGREFLQFLDEAFGVRTAPELRKKHLFSWQKHLIGRRNAKGLPLRARSVNHHILSVRGFLSFLAERGFILAETVNALKYVKEPSFLPLEALSHAQIRKVLKKIDSSSPEGYRDRTILEVLYSTGVRASELLGIRIQDVDTAHCVLRVYGKGKKERTVPLGQTALRYLETYLRAVREFLATEDAGDIVFVNNTGGPMSKDTLLRIVHRHFDGKADFSVTPHTFRRSCATEMIRSDANLYHVKELLGHETLATVKHYARLTINDLKKTHAKCHPRERDES